MPPPRCLHAAPLRVIDSALPSQSSRCLSKPNSSRSFSASSTNNYASQTVKGAPAKGVTTLRLKKKGPPPKMAKPPEPGERKAMRKRIVLSNTNALTVKDIAPLSTKIAERPAMYMLPAEVIDQLRVVEAFKPKQGWSLFQTPAVLMRKEARHLGEAMEQISGKQSGSSGSAEKSPSTASPRTIRKVICGEKGSGKSVLLLQTMAMAFQQGWIVINFPEGRELASGHTAFSPVAGSKPTEYAQPNYTANLLKQILASNTRVLQSLKVTEKPKLPFPVRDDISLAALLELGVDDRERSWLVFQAFWREITRANSSLDAAKKAGQRPPVLMCLDNMVHAMLKSKYQVLNPEGKLTDVHSHDLALVKHFTEHLSGAAKLPNGGVILAATSGSDLTRSHAMDVGIAIAETQQAPQNSPSPSPYSTPYTRNQALNPDRDPSPTALSNFHSPFQPIDTRVLDVFKSVEVVRVAGLDHGEASALMQYWTQSGVYRGTVLPWVVDEARALSGGAVVGQLEQAVVRTLRREPMVVDGETGGKKIRAH